MTAHKTKTVVGLTILVLLALTGYLLRGSIETFLRANHLLPESEPLTELYFEDHISLPSQFGADDTKTITFTVHNLEYQTLVYGIEVYASASGIRTPIQSGTITLTHDGFETLTQDFRLTEATRTAVFVELSTGQKIHVWLDPLL